MCADGTTLYLTPVSIGDCIAFCMGYYNQLQCGHRVTSLFLIYQKQKVLYLDQILDLNTGTVKGVCTGRACGTGKEN